MKWGRSAFIVAILALVVCAVQPLAKKILRAEFERRTGARLTMDRCHLNAFTGSVIIEDAVLQSTDPPDFDDDAEEANTVKIAKIWSQGSLRRLLYRQFISPVTVLDGVELSVSTSQRRMVPRLEPVTQLVNDKTLLIAPQANPFLDELDQAFRQARDAMQQERIACEQLEQQLAKLEDRSIDLDNPLRNRETLATVQQQVASLKKELDQRRGLVDRNHQVFQQASAEIAKSTAKNQASVPASANVATPDQVVAMEVQAKRLAEQLVCSSVARLTPYLGISASLTQNWLMKPTDIDPRNRRVGRSLNTVAVRGTDYRFGSDQETDLLFSSVRLRGTLDREKASLPFVGQLRNIGSRSARNEDCPSLSLSFSGEPKNDLHDSPAVVLQSNVVPDRQGFKIQCRMVPTGSMIASAAQGDWQLAAFGQTSAIQVEWIVHQSEWSLVVDLRTSQCEVVVKRNAMLPHETASDPMPRYEPCFTSNDSISLAKARFQGTVRDGSPIQNSMVLESPILQSLSQALVKQQSIYLELSQQRRREESQSAFEQTLSQQQQAIDESHRQMVAIHAKLDQRIQLQETKVAGSLPNRDDLRFSRGLNDSLIR